METMIVRFPTGNGAIMQVLNGLRKMGAITVEKSPYSDEFVEKIAKGDWDLKAGKGVKIDHDKLWM